MSDQQARRSPSEDGAVFARQELAELAQVDTRTIKRHAKRLGVEEFLVDGDRRMHMSRADAERVAAKLGVSLPTEPDHERISELTETIDALRVALLETRMRAETAEAEVAQAHETIGSLKAEVKMLDGRVQSLLLGDVLAQAERIVRDQ